MPTISKIEDILRRTRIPLSTKEIIDALMNEYAIRLDKHALNRVLYGSLKGRVAHDEQFRWRLVSSNTQAETFDRASESSSEDLDQPVSPFGLNYPVADYLKPRVVDGITLSRGGPWWSALLAIREPNTDRVVLKMYLWKSAKGSWKRMKSFPIRSKKAASALSDALSRFGPMLS